MRYLGADFLGLHIALVSMSCDTQSELIGRRRGAKGQVLKTLLAVVIIGPT